MEVVGNVYGGSIETQWVPVNGTSQLYVGQVVYSLGDGVDSLGQASGAADTTGLKVPYGIVSGVNTKEPVFDTATSNSNTVTGVQTQAAQVAREVLGAEGQYVKGDLQALVKIDRIFPGTKIKANLYNAARGTAPTLQTVTAGSTTGLGYTANATDVAGVADLCTAYCRTGANAGLRRITDDTSTTVVTNDTAFQQDIAIGDTFVRVPMRPIGTSFVQTDASALYLDVSITPATDYWAVETHELNLQEAGREYIIFSFAEEHFNLARA